MSKVRLLAACVALIACALLPASASGAFAPVGTIAWPSGDPETGPVDIYSYSWGVSQTSTAGHGGGLGSGKVKSTDFDLTKGITEGTPRYVYDLAKGKTLPSVRIDLNSSPNLSYCLSQVRITHIVDLAADPTDDPVAASPLEHVSLSFEKIAVQITVNTKQGSGFVVATINLKTNTVSLGSTNACPNLP